MSVCSFNTEKAPFGYIGVGDWTKAANILGYIPGISIITGLFRIMLSKAAEGHHARHSCLKKEQMRTHAKRGAVEMLCFGIFFVFYDLYKTYKDYKTLPGRISQPLVNE